MPEVIGESRKGSSADTTRETASNCSLQKATLNTARQPGRIESRDANIRHASILPSPCPSRGRSATIGTKIEDAAEPTEAG